MEHPDRQSHVVAHVLALLEPSAAQDSSPDGIGAHLTRVCHAAVTGLGMSGAAVTLKSVNGSEAIVAAVDGDSRASAELSSGSARVRRATRSGWVAPYLRPTSGTLGSPGG